MYYLNHFFAVWLTPPGCFLLLTALGILLWRYRPGWGKFFIASSFFGLWLLSMPMIAQQLINGLQYQYPTLSPNDLRPTHESAAIVVLDAGINSLTPEYGRPNVSNATLDRLQYAAFLHKKMRLPILVSGNYPMTPNINDAEEMAKGLYDYFGVRARWLEDKGVNTAEEGIFVSAILKKAGVNKIYLVTHAYHMPRSIYAFQNQGLEVIPAPTHYILFNYHLKKLSAPLPSMEALHGSSQALHEYIGMIWYRFINLIKT